jgi:uncharacterized protein (DUF2267 family)
MGHHTDPFAPSVQTARAWLAAVMDGLGTTDRAFGYRATKAWLHAVRDRLDITAATHLAAQLPEVWRGAFFSGWRPGPAPVRPRVSGLVEQFAAETGIEKSEVPGTLGSITTTLDSLFSAGQLDHAIAKLPTALVNLLWGELPPEPDIADDAKAASARQHSAAAGAPVDRLGALERRVDTLVDAIAVLAKGLEDVPVGSAPGGRSAEAAQQAHRILLTQRTGTIAR